MSEKNKTPKPEEVKTLPVEDPEKNHCVKCAQRQTLESTVVAELDKKEAEK